LFEPAIKVENWLLEKEFFHNHITAHKELVALCAVLRRPKMTHTTAIPTVVELSPVGIFHGNHTAKGTYTQHQTCRRNTKLQR